MNGRNRICTHFQRQQNPLLIQINRTNLKSIHNKKIFLPNLIHNTIFIADSSVTFQQKEKLKIRIP